MKIVPSCFGKLPVHADFIRLQPSHELNDFDRWIQEGLLALQGELGEGWTHAFEAAPRVRFARSFPSKKSVLVGVVAPSKGKAGRHYPFVVATTISDKRLLQRPGLLPLICDDYLTAAEALIQAGGQGNSAREVQAAVAALPSEPDLEGADRRLEAALHQTPQEILLTASLGAWDERRYRVYAALKRRLAGEERPIRIPSAPASGVVALWLEVLRASQGKRGTLPTLVTWGGAPGTSGDIRFLLREPRGTDLRQLLIRSDLRGLCDLAGEGELGSARAGAGPLAADGKRPVAQLVSSLLSG